MSHQQSHQSIKDQLKLLKDRAEQMGLSEQTIYLLDKLEADFSKKVDPVLATVPMPVDVADAPLQTPNYVQADVQAIASLANETKIKLNLIIMLLLDLHEVIMAMNDSN